MNLKYDLHIHSCLSPCGDSDMTPGNIVGMAMIKGLDVIAVTDHNSCCNCGAAIEVGKQYGVTVIPGMELTTAEEVHVICLFPTLQDAMQWDGYVYEHLMDIPNQEEIFGAQHICNAEDAIIGKKDKLLINATDITFEHVYGLVEAANGIMMPAHIDKQANSLLGNLGFVPPDSKFHVAEVKDLKELHRLQKSNPYLLGCRILSDSDAHYLADINEKGYTLVAEENTPDAILHALKSEVTHCP